MFSMVIVYPLDHSSIRLLKYLMNIIIWKLGLYQYNRVFVPMHAMCYQLLKTVYVSLDNSFSW